MLNVIGAPYHPASSVFRPASLRAAGGKGIRTAGCGGTPKAYMSAQPKRPVQPLVLLQELSHPVGHRLPVVEVCQDDGITEAITPEPAFIQHLPGGEGAATGVPGQAEQPYPLLCRGRVRLQVPF